MYVSILSIKNLEAASAVVRTKIASVLYGFMLNLDGILPRSVV
jgi:hypothetical protein